MAETMIKWSGIRKFNRGVVEREETSFKALFDECDYLGVCDCDAWDNALLKKYGAIWDDFKDGDGDIIYSLFKEWCSKMDAVLTDLEAFMAIKNNMNPAYYHSFLVQTENEWREITTDDFDENGRFKFLGEE